VPETTIHSMMRGDERGEEGKASGRATNAWGRGAEAIGGQNNKHHTIYNRTRLCDLSYSRFDRYMGIGDWGFDGPIGVETRGPWVGKYFGWK
jgi:hypothetical protein